MVEEPLNPFRHKTGQRKLKNLFYEQSPADKTGVVYTLKNHDHMGYPSMYRLYMEYDDPTEYSFAIATLDGWDHWEILCECTWFKPYVTKWRKELDVRTRARALNKIKQVSNSEAKEAYQAHKFLVSGGWKEDTARRGAGRPSKEEIQTEAKRLAHDAQSLEDDFQRISGVN